MRCFARWKNDTTANVSYRDQTILQFGTSWGLIANVVLLNPGSALPLNEIDQSDLLRSKSLPFFVEPEAGEKYVEFSIDRLMNDVLGLFSKHFDGGTIRLLNLFNLKNQHSAEAIQQSQEHYQHNKMFSPDSEICYCGAPVIIASGDGAKNNQRLTEELLRHISLASASELYALTNVDGRRFAIKRARPNENGMIDSYHPSYTFKYGNTTEIGEFKP
jgi:hypothetical protein